MHHFRTIMSIRIWIRIHLLACMNLLWDILRLPSSHRAALGHPICHSCAMTSAGREPATTRIAAYRSSPRYALCHGEKVKHHLNDPKVTSVAQETTCKCMLIHIPLVGAIIKTVHTANVTVGIDFLQMM